MNISKDVSENIKNMKLINLLSKHVFNLNSDKAFHLMGESIKIGYEYCLWNVARNHIQDFHFDMDIILKMEKDNYCHPLRVVVCRYDFSDKLYYWCDNMHSAVMYIRKYGIDVMLKNIPFYIVYVNKGGVGNIYDYKGLVRTDKESLDGLVNCAIKRYKRSNSKSILDIGYQVGDFCMDNPDFIYYGKVDNGSASLEILKDKYVFWDIDGTLATYRFNNHVSDPCGTDNGMSLQEIEEGIFLNRLPLRKMQKIVTECKAKKNIIMGHVQNQKEMDDKQLWLDKYYPSITDRLLVFESVPKYKTILEYCNKNNIPLKDVIFVDDVLPFLRDAERNEICSYHISSFLDLI